MLKVIQINLDHIHWFLIYIYKTHLTKIKNVVEKLNKLTNQNIPSPPTVQRYI